LVANNASKIHLRSSYTGSSFGFHVLNYPILWGPGLATRTNNKCRYFI
jgi:hypothetical protein